MHSDSNFSVKEENAMALSCYVALCPIAGKRGYKIRRLCRLSGKTNSESYSNLCCALVENKGFLPQKVWLSLILCGENSYYMVYHQYNTSPTESRITHAEYCPPRDGGQFEMPEICLTLAPVLGEISYHQTLTVYI